MSDEPSIVQALRRFGAGQFEAGREVLTEHAWPILLAEVPGRHDWMGTFFQLRDAWGFQPVRVTPVADASGPG